MQHLGRRLALIVMFVLLGGAGCGRSPQPVGETPAALLTVPPRAAADSAAVAVESEGVVRPNPDPTRHMPVPATPELPPLRLQRNVALPPAVQSRLDAVVARQPDWQWLPDAAAAPDVTFHINGGLPLATWVLAVVAPMPTVTDDIGLTALQARWLGQGGPLVVDETVMPLVQALWGAPGPAVASLPRAAVGERLWQRDDAVAIVPFDTLTPDLKVLRIDGGDPLRHDFDVRTYPLAVTVGVDGPGRGLFLLRWPGRLTNRDADRLTRVAMTGVTALVRATAWQMENVGITWPGEAVKPLFDAADFVHISNEVSFVPTCPFPNPNGGASFCSDDRYLELLAYIGTDIVELTGNHVNDYGRDYLARTLDLYAERGWHTFGGGRNAEEAARPLLLEHNGNRIAFVGCNFLGPVYAWATADEPGSRRCDGTVAEDIGRLSAENYRVIATLQYDEYYFYEPTAQQRQDFAALAAAGAVGVSGSQGHHAQAVAFANGAFIHYGLGNLFFDQMQMLGTRQAFVDTYVFYDNRLLSVTLDTFLIEDFARPRAMTADERAAVLRAIFAAGGW